MGMPPPGCRRTAEAASLRRGAQCGEPGVTFTGTGPSPWSPPSAHPLSFMCLGHRYWGEKERKKKKKKTKIVFFFFLFRSADHCETFPIRLPQLCLAPLSCPAKETACQPAGQGRTCVPKWVPLCPQMGCTTCPQMGSTECPHMGNARCPQMGCTVPPNRMHSVSLEGTCHLSPHGMCHMSPDRTRRPSPIGTRRVSPDGTCRLSPALCPQQGRAKCQVLAAPRWLPPAPAPPAFGGTAAGAGPAGGAGEALISAGVT